MNQVSFSPVTRVSGLLSVDLRVGGGRIVDARVIGAQYRGFEFMLRGRSVDDAVYFTSRICGICSATHAYVAARLLDDLYGLAPPPAGARLRQVMLASEFLQNHLRHAYLLGLPDYLTRLEALSPAGSLSPRRAASPAAEDARFAPVEAERLRQHYLEAIAVSRKCHDLLAAFGGKVPHQHGMVRGGVTVRLTADTLRLARALLAEVKSFIHGAWLPDAQLVAARYPEYFALGVRPPDFLTYGLFAPELGPHVPPAAILQGRAEPVDPAAISEAVDHAWYAEDPADEPRPDPEKPGGYSWIKAPRYRGTACEGGPVARLTAFGLRPPHPAGTMDRILARAQEAALLAEWIEVWLDAIEPGEPVLAEAGGLAKPAGLALHDATRGPLLHQCINTAGMIDRYTIITPTTWNFSSRDASGQRGAAEQALLGAALADPAHPEVEAGRIIRAFDPCLSCATHIVDLDAGGAWDFVI